MCTFILLSPSSSFAGLCVKSWCLGNGMASVSWLPVPAPAPSRRLSREDAVNAEMKMQFGEGGGREGGGGETAVSCLASSVWQVWDNAADNENAAAAADLFGILATTTDDEICTREHENGADANVDAQKDIVCKTTGTAPAVSDQDKSATKTQSETTKGEGVVSPSSSVGPTSCGAAADDEERERDRKKRNRESAKLSRARKRVRQEHIVVQVRELEEENARLSNELAAAYAKLRQLSKSAEGVTAHAVDDDASLKDKDNVVTTAGNELEVKVKGGSTGGDDNSTPAAPVADAISNEGEVGHQRGDREMEGSKTSSGQTIANGKSPRT